MNATAAPRPIVILLESFVLDAIGALSDDRAALAERMVEGVVPGEGRWRARLMSELGLTEAMATELATLWNANRAALEAADPSQATLHFASMVVEQNFADIIAVLDGPADGGGRAKKGRRR